MLEGVETPGSHTIDNDNKDKESLLGALHQIFTKFRTKNTVKPVLKGTWA